MGKWFLRLISAMVWLLVGINANAQNLQNEEPDTLKVGFFEFNGYHMMDTNGVRSGYGYDVLQILRPYMHCKYDYVGFEKGWSEMLPMLESGELDLVTGAVKTPEKLEKFDFSSIPIGNSSVIMTVKAGHSKYRSKDYAHWAGIRVGMIPGNSKNDVFHDFSKKKGFTYETHYFKHSDKLSEALQSGRVDAIVTGSLRKIGNEVIYEQFDVKPFYIIVKKGNAKLLARINAALEALSFETPGFSGELQQHYYGRWHNKMKNLPFTASDLAFIREANKTNRRFVVLLRSDHFPLAYLKDGKPRGVFVDIVEMISCRSELNFKFVVAENTADYFRIRAARKCDLVMDVPHNFRWAEESGYVLTKPYYQIGVSILTEKKDMGDIRTIGVVRDSIIHHDALKYKPFGVPIEAYPSNDAAVEAVLSGEVDGAYLLDPIADSAVLNDRSGRLIQEHSGRVIDCSVGIRDNMDARFISIMSKCVNSFSPQELQTVNHKNNLLLDKPISIRDLIAENPLVFSLSGIAVIALLFGVLLIVLIYHRRSVRAAALLAKNSRMWRQLLDALPIHIFAKDVNNEFKFVFNNKAREDFYGISEDKFYGMDDFAILDAELAAERRQADLELCTAGKGMNKVFVRVKDKTGAYRRLYTILVPFFEPDGTKLILASSIDQTELEEARTRAQESAEWFEKTLVSIGDGVMATDTDGNITLINPVAEKLFDATLADCKGKPHTDYFNIVNYRDGSPITSPVKLCLQTGEIATLAGNTDLISKNGMRYHIADSAAPIRNQAGKIIGAVLVFRDVTKEYELRTRLQTTAAQLQVALEQAQHASSAKGIFLSQMSHEIRTPLNAVIGYLNIAQNNDNDSKRIKDCLDKGLIASNQLLAIINDVLDISAIESGKLKIAAEDFDFKHVLTKLVSMVYQQAEKKRIVFETHSDGLTEEWLVGDSLRINQILLNLLSNAIKFTPEGGRITLLVKQVAIVRNRVRFLIQVTDTGCGINEKFKAKLFEPFGQQDASVARKFGGTGLGLSITRNLVTIMGGVISVDSEEGKGTTFTVHLSFERSSRSRAVTPVDFSKLRALIVDDRDEDRVHVQLVLNMCGVRCDVVDSGEDAVRQLELCQNSPHPYDLCLLDFRLSGIDGVETARRIRKVHGNASGLPIVLVTACDLTNLSADAYAAGVSKIIQKPLFQSTIFDFLMSNYYQDNYQNNEKPVTQKAENDLTGLSVMLVEDNHMNMDISVQYLERAGIKVTPAWNGKEAVDLFVKSDPGTYQAILMDIQMPIMDGYQATEAIRSSRHPEAKVIPIIAMTANAFNEDVVKAIKSGMNDHIAKPVVYDHLFASLSALVLKKDGKKSM